MRFPNREWLRPVLQARGDHLAIELPPAASVIALRRHILIPWSTLRNVEVTDAPWPHPLHLERLGSHLPRLAAYGTFYVGGERRFLCFLKGDRVVQFLLKDHPYERVVVGLEEPEALARAARAHAEAAMESRTLP